MIDYQELQQIIQARVDQEGSQAALARLIGLDATVLSEVRRGIRKPSARVLKKLGYERIVRYRRVRE